MYKFNPLSLNFPPFFMECYLKRTQILERQCNLTSSQSLRHAEGEAVLRSVNCGSLDLKQTIFLLDFSYYKIIMKFFISAKSLITVILIDWLFIKFVKNQLPFESRVIN